MHLFSVENVQVYAQMNVVFLSKVFCGAKPRKNVFYTIHTRCSEERVFINNRDHSKTAEMKSVSTYLILINI